MAKALVVHGDRVSGTNDLHTVSGTGTDTSTGSPAPAVWTGTYDYDGTVSVRLSRLVSIGGSAVAVTTSRCSQPGGHPPGGGRSFVPQVPTVPVPTTSTLVFTTTVGSGTPSTGTGSSFVTVGGAPVLLDGDAFDTCGGETGSGNSTVAAQGQSFVTAAE